MREIRFRLACKDDFGTLFFLYPTSHDLLRGHFNIENIGRIREIIGQDEFTGLHDKNGKEVWEGDILQSEGIKTITDIVTFADGMFCFGDSNDPLRFWAAASAVIGHIYEKPERLKGGPPCQEKVPFI